MVKIFKIIALCLLLSSCSFQKHTISESLRYTGWVPYQISSDFSTKQKELIKKAISHFSNMVGCVEFVEADMLGLASSKPVLLFKPMIFKKTKDIGRFIKKDQTILLSIKESDSIFYKCILHALAHASGMDGHRFSEEDMHVSQLSPIVSKRSLAMLYPKDIYYLKHLICNSKL